MAVLPAPVLPRSQTTGAVAWARWRAPSSLTPGGPDSPNRPSLMAPHNRSRIFTRRHLPSIPTRKRSHGNVVAEYSETRHLTAEFNPSQYGHMDVAPLEG